MTYDDWKTETPEDEYARRHPHARGGVYAITLRRTIEATITIEVEAANEDDARDDAEQQAKGIPLDKWSLDQDDTETLEVEGPPERDPDDERDERMDRELDR